MPLNSTHAERDSGSPELPPAVRVLPMSRKVEFPHCKTVEELQIKFFLHELPKRPNGMYRYHERGLKAKPGTLVLFQSDGLIVASATLTGIEKFPQPDAENYKGSLYFDVNSVRAFEPLDLATISAIWPNVKSFARCKYDLDPGKFTEFSMRLKYIGADNA